ncbi:FadR/GntR family transcriptional regulator [Carnobacterium sp.]|uniref:FadR/GntR family transcriptional regulator n=1 Tax=Carnobacterium sp. TaxID=48221 RepID=UPI002FC92DEC
MSNRNLVNQTIQKLENLLGEGTYQVGDKLPVEKVLAEECGVGRSTLREAVKILEHAGVLTVKQGSGTYVNQHRVATYSTEQLLEIREMLEVQSGKLATSRFTTEELMELKEVLFERNEALEKGLFAHYVEADLNFHWLIVKASRNPFLIRWYQEILPDLKQTLSSFVLRTDNYSDNTELHQVIFQALVEQDEATVVAATLENNQRELVRYAKK